MAESINQEFFQRGDERHNLSSASNGLNLLDLMDRGSTVKPRSAEDLVRELSASLLSDYGNLHLGGRGTDSLPILGKDSFYGIDPLTGNVRAYPSVRLDIWTKDDKDAADIINKRGWSYGLDEVSGRVTTCPNIRTDLYTKDDADRARIIRDRGWYYGLDPSTGRVVHYPSGPQLD